MSFVCVSVVAALCCEIKSIYGISLCLLKLLAWFMFVASVNSVNVQT